MLGLNQLVEAFQASNSMSSHPLAALPKSGKGDGLQESVSRVSSYAESLYKNPKYSKYLLGMEEGRTKQVTAMLMDNWARATAHMQESTKATAIANFDKYAFPLIRAILPALATSKLFSTQPMFGPTSQVFYFDYVHGTTNGVVTAGSKLFENHDPNYGDSQIDLEILNTGNGATANYTGSLAHPPIVAGTVTITDGTQVVTDDGNGNLIGDIAAGTNTINYTTGAYNVTFAANVGNGDAIEASYTVDSEANESGIPEIDLVLTTSPVVARSKKIRFRWSMESAFSLRDNLGLEAEAELLTAAAAEIGYGIDSDNLASVKRVALDKRLDADFQFDRTTPAGISFTEYKHEFVDYLIAGSSYILRQSGRAVGNWIVGGEEVTNIIESLAPRFVAAAVVPASRGILELGVLDGKWTIFKDANVGSEAREFLMGFMGKEFLYAGYVWAPWITAFTTPSTVLDDFQGRKGIGSLYGKKIVNANYYLRMKIVRT